MTYIVQRKTRFYVVAYDGLDPLTGRERRRWIPIGHDRAEAEAVVARLDSERIAGPAPRRGTVTVGEFLTRTWMPPKRRHVRATTAYRYAWFIDRYINPRSATSRCADSAPITSTTSTNSSPRPAAGTGTGLAPKTIARGAHDRAGRARRCRRPRTRQPQRRLPRPQPSTSNRPGRPPDLDRSELHQFLTAAAPQRLYPALHLAAHTGMRRGEVVGLKWCDLDTARSRLSISRSLQNVGGKPVEFGVKTRTSRRTVELDQHTRRRPRPLASPASTRRASRTTPTTGCSATPAAASSTPNRSPNSSIASSQRSDVPRIRFHDLRHTHASLLVADGVAIKVVSERLGHAHPAFTMHTYQHLLPGMSATAAEQFATLVATAGR